MLQGALLGRQRGVNVLLLQRALGRLHLLGRLGKDGQDAAKRRVGWHDPAVHPAEQGLDLLSQSSLRQSQEHKVLAILLLGESVAVPYHVERRRDDLTLRLGESPRVAAAASASSTAALGLGGPEVATKGTDLEKIQVALDHALAVVPSLVVAGAAVVGHKVARFEIELFKEERMPSRNFLEAALLRVKEADRLLRPSVDRVGQAERPHAEVVVGARLEIDLLDGVGVRVTARLGEHHRRRLVGQHVNRELRRRVDPLPARPLKLDLIEPVLVDHEARRQNPVLANPKIGGRGLVEHQSPGRGRHGREDADVDLCAAQDRDIAAVLDQARLQACIGREDKLQLKPVDIGQVDDV